MSSSSMSWVDCSCGEVLPASLNSDSESNEFMAHLVAGHDMHHNTLTRDRLSDSIHGAFKKKTGQDLASIIGTINQDD